MRHPLPKTILALAAVHTAFAQSDSIPTYDLAPFVVVAPNVWSAQASVLRDQISSAKPMDLASTLSAAMPSVALTRRGPLAGDLVLRGFSRDNILITVNDNQTFCACPNRMDPPAFHLSSQQIESIQIRKGPFSVDQGSSVGGAIAVRTTASTETAFARAYGYVGRFNYYAAGATFGAPVSNSFALIGGAYYQRGDAYKTGSGLRFTELPGTNFLPQFRDTKAFEVISFESTASLRLSGGGQLTANYAYQDAKDVLYPGLRMDAPTDTMNRIAVTLNLPVSMGIADSIEANVAYSHVDHDMTDARRTSVNNMGGQFVVRGYFMRTQATSAFASLRLGLRKAIGESSLLRYGIDTGRRYWDADNIIGMMPNDMLPDTVSDKTGAWAVLEHRQNGWSFESGGRLDYAKTRARKDISFVQSIQNTTTNDQTDVLPSLYALLSRDITPSLTLYTGLGMATRLPDPQERYINLDRPMANPDWVGNPDLKPVRNIEWQGGMQWRKSAFDARLSIFHAWVADYIYLVRLNPIPGIAPGGATSYANIDVRLYGLTLDGGWNLNDILRIEGGLSWQRGVKSERPLNVTNDVVAEIPPLRARIAALFAYAAITAKAEVEFQDDLKRIDADLGERELDGWAIVNLAAGWRIHKHVTLSAGVDNLFNKDYAVANAYLRNPFGAGNTLPEPGRFWYLRAGIEF